MFDVINSRSKKKHLYNQIILGMAVFDLANSFAWMMSTSAFPVEEHGSPTNIYGAMGNNGTCKVSQEGRNILIGHVMNRPHFLGLLGPGFFNSIGLHQHILQRNVVNLLLPMYLFKLERKKNEENPTLDALDTNQSRYYLGISWPAILSAD